MERRSLFEQSNPPFSEVTSNAAQASGHTAVWAEFELP
jgi:hypothetical protein